jgi:hypothetical protein
MSSRILRAGIAVPPSPNHNICYSPASSDAIPLASQYQFRWVLSLFQNPDALIPVRYPG